jgi:hypothetical protein
MGLELPRDMSPKTYPWPQVPVTTSQPTHPGVQDHVNIILLC